MTNKTFEQLNQELINKGLIFEDAGQYEESQQLESIYPWGYILVYSCAVLPSVYRLYDNEHQLICTLDSDDDNWSILNGYLKCTRSGFGPDKKFTYSLNNGAPIHVKDVKALLLKCPDVFSTDEDRIIIYDDNGKPRALRKRDCKSLEDITDSVLELTEYINQGYKLLSEDVYAPNVDIFNDMIVTKF